MVMSFPRLRLVFFFRATSQIKVSSLEDLLHVDPATAHLPSNNESECQGADNEAKLARSLTGWLRSTNGILVYTVCQALASLLDGSRRCSAYASRQARVTEPGKYQNHVVRTQKVSILVPTIYVCSLSDFRGVTSLHSHGTM